MTHIAAFNPETDLKSADGYRYSRYKLRYNRSCC